MRNAIGVGLVRVAQLVQENRELVAAQPGERVALPQAGLQATRHRREQLVTHQVAKTVVDDLEAVEVQIERREWAAARRFFELFEAAPEPLHEDRAVAEPGQRIEECGTCGAAPARSLAPSCRSAIRRCGSSDGRRSAHRDTAAQEPPVGAVLVPDPVLVLKVIGLAGEMCLERRFERSDVISMDTVHPVSGRPMPAGAGRPSIARHRLEL